MRSFSDDRLTRTVPGLPWLHLQSKTPARRSVSSLEAASSLHLTRCQALPSGPCPHRSPRRGPLVNCPRLPGCAVRVLDIGSTSDSSTPTRTVSGHRRYGSDRDHSALPGNGLASNRVESSPNRRPLEHRKTQTPWERCGHTSPKSQRTYAGERSFIPSSPRPSQRWKPKQWLAKHRCNPNP